MHHAPVKHRYDVLATIEKAHSKDRHVAREGVNDGQNPRFLAPCQLIMHEIHRPDLIGAESLNTVIPQLRFHPPFRRFVPELHA